MLYIDVIIFYTIDNKLCWQPSVISITHKDISLIMTPQFISYDNLF